LGYGSLPQFLCGGKNVKIFSKNIVFALIIKEPQQKFKVFNTY
jgi:hypothetical protein